jgi:hypothetical protein
MTVIEWLLSGDTGISSEVICAVMTNSKGRSAWECSPPYDPSDFGRCYRLLNLFPEWKARMPEVGTKYPEWGPLVREWDSLTALYEKEIKNKDGRAPMLYARMKDLLDQGRLEAGWENPHPGCWRGPKRTETKIGKGVTVTLPNR